MENVQSKELIKQLTRIADAMEEGNKLKKMGVVIEKKTFNRQFKDVSEKETPTQESNDSQSIEHVEN